MDTPDTQIGGFQADKPWPNNRVVEACYRLAKLVAAEMGTLNGSTALYWHLISVIQDHAGHRPTKENES